MIPTRPFAIHHRVRATGARPQAPTKDTSEKEPYAEHLEAFACSGERLCIVTAWALQQEAL